MRKAWLAIFAALLLTALCGAATADGAPSGLCGDGLTWSLDDFGGMAFADLTSVDAIVLPFSVNSIADSAFHGTDAVLIVPAGSCAEGWAEGHEVEYSNGL